jgi:hypothetical protein
VPSQDADILWYLIGLLGEKWNDIIIIYLCLIQPVTFLYLILANITLPNNVFPLLFMGRGGGAIFFSFMTDGNSQFFNLQKLLKKLTVADDKVDGWGLGL